MKRAFSIGNGESRKGLDLETLRPHGTIAGCNALYRDFEPDILFCVDQNMCREILQAKYPGILVYKCEDTRTVETFFGGHSIWVEPYDPLVYGNCGAISVYFLCKWHKPGEVYLVGHDFFPHPERGMNNVYKGTLNYSHQGHKMGYNDGWRKAMEISFETFSNTLFVIVNSVENLPQIGGLWGSFDNVDYMTLELFKEEIKAWS